MPVSIRKLYYSIAEVAEITGVEPHVLRFWEGEFKLLAPAKNKGGNRIYTERDIQIVQVIRALLKDKGYTIEAANSLIRLKDLPDLVSELRQPDVKSKKREILLEIRSELAELQEKLKTWSCW